jgi:tetratricopeptide (TPR) repeat protein
MVSSPAELDNQPFWLSLIEEERLHRSEKSEKAMPTSILKQEEFSQRYAVVIGACCELAQAYFYLGRVADAQHLLRTLLQLIEASEAKPHDRLKSLLLLGEILTIDHFLNDTDATLLFEPLLQARQIAETVPDKQGLANALSLLGQAHYFVTLVTRVNTGASPNSPQDQGHYNEAFTYQQHALQLREALNDSRGQAESHFHLGVVYERWRQGDLAVAHYAQALQIAEQAGHLFERCEPTRHLAWNALWKGDLEAALTYAKRALSLREAAGFRPYLPFDHLLLSDIYRKQEDEPNALLHVEVGSALAREVGSSRALAWANERLKQFNQPEEKRGASRSFAPPTDNP